MDNTVTEKIKEAAYRHATFDPFAKAVFRNPVMEQSFTSGANWMREELAREQPSNEAARFAEWKDMYVSGTLRSNKFCFIDKKGNDLRFYNYEKLYQYWATEINKSKREHPE